jgi:hypothetical protein
VCRLVWFGSDRNVGGVGVGLDGSVGRELVERNWIVGGVGLGMVCRIGLGRASAACRYELVWYGVSVRDGRDGFGLSSWQEEAWCVEEIWFDRGMAWLGLSARVGTVG